LPGVLAIALRFALIADNDLKWLNPVMIAGIAFNIVCNLLLAEAAPGIDGLGAIGAAISLTNWLILGCLVVVVHRSQRIPDGLPGRAAGLATRDLLTRGIPLGAIFFTETLLFTGSSVLMGYVGKVALAAHGVALLWLNVALMVPIGISQAAMARIATLSGQRRLDAIPHAAAVAVLSVVVASALMGALLVAGSDEFIRLAMWSRSAAAEAVVDAGRAYFRFCAVTQLLSGLVIVMASILRGLGDHNAVLWLVMLGYWGVGLGGCVVLAFVLGFGGSGIWMGIVLAFVFAAALLAVRLWRASVQLSPATER
jgi:MATE family multidrug resistance protein